MRGGSRGRLRVSSCGAVAAGASEFSGIAARRGRFRGACKVRHSGGLEGVRRAFQKERRRLFKRQLYDESASWIYTAFAAEMFAEFGGEMPFELKSAILEDLPSFFDFYETMAPCDKPAGVCRMLASIHSLYPAQFRKYRRAAYAIALIYDDEPPIDWPECNVPSNPTRMSVPTEIFFILRKIRPLSFSRSKGSP